MLCHTRTLEGTSANRKHYAAGMTVQQPNYSKNLLSLSLFFLPGAVVVEALAVDVLEEVAVALVERDVALAPLKSLQHPSSLFRAPPDSR